MTIGKLAKEAQVNVETVRYYQRVGLLEIPDKPERGFRSYHESHLTQLLFIRRAKGLGFSLERIRSLLELRDRPDACSRACETGRRTLEEIRNQIRELRFGAFAL